MYSSIDVHGRGAGHADSAAARVPARARRGRAPAHVPCELACSAGPCAERRVGHDTTTTNNNNGNTNNTERVEVSHVVTEQLLYLHSSWIHPSYHAAAGP
jgi:hypothetical protein